MAPYRQSNDGRGKLLPRLFICHVFVTMDCYSLNQLDSKLFLLKGGHVDEINHQPEIQVAQKKPYEKPNMIYLAPLEATAGVCSVSPGKVDLGQCAILST